MYLQSTTGQAEARPAVSKRVSPLFEGATLFQQMNKSAFGRFDAAIRGVDSHLQLPLTPLPKVIVIGGKNAGKSSLLESITKCAIFPRGSSLCTKRPIKLQLQQVKTSAECSVHVLHDDKSVLLTSIDDLLGTVEAIMKPLDSISDDEIVVRICQVHASIHPSCMLYLHPRRLFCTTPVCGTSSATRRRFQAMVTSSLT